MRSRLILALPLVLTMLAGCTAGSPSTAPATPSRGVSTTSAAPSSAPRAASSGGPAKTATGYCLQLDAAAPKINAAQTALYSGKSSDQAIDELAAQLTVLEAGAPPQLKAALADMVEQFRSARDMLQRPTMQDRDRIAAFGLKVSNDNRVLAEYVSAHCPTP